MKITVILTLATLLPLITIWFIAIPVRAEETTCQGFLGAVTMDNLRVPQDAACTLDGTQIEGTIIVERNATLIASNIDVIGNIQAEEAARVEVLPESIVGGSVQIVKSGAALINSAQIHGDLFFDDNQNSISAMNNLVGGNLQAFQNSGGLLVVNNTIDGNLQCKENTPVPIVGENTVMGNKEDQCANMTAHIVFLPSVLRP